MNTTKATIESPSPGLLKLQIRSRQWPLGPARRYRSMGKSVRLRDLVQGTSRQSYMETVVVVRIDYEVARRQQVVSICAATMRNERAEVRPEYRQRHDELTRLLRMSIKFPFGKGVRGREASVQGGLSAIENHRGQSSTFPDRHNRSSSAAR